MTEVHQVIIHVQLPTATREARLAYGFYTVTDGVVTMTDRLGNPATDETGKTYTQKLSWRRRTIDRRKADNETPACADRKVGRTSGLPFVNQVPENRTRLASRTASLRKNKT